jgi:glycosyltransferase involved in cell wall biosynthesis
MHTHVSLVIRCYNEEQHIGRLLSGLMQQTVPAPEIIVVDSGSTDATLSIAARYPVQIISIRPEQFSFGYSLNVGCRAASNEHIVIASAHVYPVYQDWLERLLVPFADPQVALVYGRQRGNEVTKYAEHRVFARWFPEQSNSWQETPFCNNANAAIRRSVWEHLPYDETLTGLEDIDWANRAMQRGYRIAYAADAEIVHVHNETPRRIYNRYRREAIALKRIFPHEHFRRRDFVRLLTANVVSDCMHAAREGVLRQNFSDILMFRLMQFWGTYRGFALQGPVSSQIKQTFYYPGGWKPARSDAQRQRTAHLIDYSGTSPEYGNMTIIEQERNTYA